FGMMLDATGKPFKTRSGKTIKLSDLLDEAELRSTNILAERHSDLEEADRVKVINALAIGAIKYADLSKNRSSNYVFNWDSMLSFEGNTAPYLLYAYTRIQSIFRKSKHITVQDTDKFSLKETIERKMSLILIRFHDVLNKVEKEGKPHLLCSYLYELASHFMSFYESCPILNTNIDPEQQKSRLMLCDITAKTLKIGLDLLGIQTVDRM
ncbi:MAG: arginine--tRNA ligase, partial [Endozoicomonadaceae bacterium]|nr:arginine--tRNA ligase [Endozoicomonadaceae bacterium]